MNAFRLAADLSHITAQTWLVWTVQRTKSVAHISGKSQLLFLLVFLCRYMDLFVNFYSLYLSLVKVFYILLSLVTVMGIYRNIKNRRTLEADSFRVEILLVTALILAMAVNHEFSVMEVLWAFSIYLEAVAMIPQMCLVRKTGGSKLLTRFYLPLMGSYRVLYILNWIFRYHYEGFYDEIAIAGGVVQTLTYLLFLVLMWCKPVTVASVTVLDYDYQEVTEDVFDNMELARLVVEEKD